MRFLWFVLLLQWGCRSAQKINEYDISPILNEKIKIALDSDQMVKLDWCKGISFKWDKIIILPPYVTTERVKKYKLLNIEAIEKLLPELTSNENLCILLFVDNNYIEKYSFVDRQPLDFNYINGTDSIKTITKKMGCGQLYIVRNRDRSLSISYK